MKQRFAALDSFRLAAAVLVVAIHTSPLNSFSETADFWLCRILARTAVPFFLMVSGYFLALQNWEGVGRFLRKAAALYGASILLYLPVNLWQGGATAAVWLRKLLVDGTLYHLWYFPAVMLGVCIARALWRLGRPAAFGIAGVLYLIGLGGDSWYGLSAALPALKGFYQLVFSVCSYTRNGLFLAPLFLLLGAAGLRLPRRSSCIGCAVSLLAMSIEGFLLRAAQLPRHDSMYLFLPVVMVFLFSLLLSVNAGENKPLRTFSMRIYILHPMAILFVRAAAKALRLQALLIENSLVHFLAVLAVSGIAAWLLPWPPRPTARAWREISLGALRHNIQVLRTALPKGCALMGVVKADAYGHGAVLVARAMQKSGVRAFAVACLTEGIALRKSGIRGEILVLGYTAPEDAALLCRWRLSQAVADAAHGQALAASGYPVQIHLGLDTGMHRLGIPAEDFAAIAALYRCRNLRVRGVFSHLCTVDSLAESDAAYAREQLSRFYETVAWLRQHGYPTGKVHIQASYGVLNLPAQSCDYAQVGIASESTSIKPDQPCDYARVGIALYGVRSSSAPVRRALDLRPVLSLRARVASVRMLAAGESAGYSRAFRASQPTRIAALAIGYADGLPRELPEKGGCVLIRGQRCMLIGRLCMDQALVDVTHVPDAAAGDTATLIGRDGTEVLRAEDIAAQCGTITNELLSRLSRRLTLIPV